MATTHQACCDCGTPCWVLLDPCPCNPAFRPHIAVRCSAFEEPPQLGKVHLIHVVLANPDASDLGTPLVEFDACYEIVLPGIEFIPPEFSETDERTTVGEELEDCDACCGPAPKACCFPDGTCEDLPPEECRAMGGIPNNQGLLCADVECPLHECPTCTDCNDATVEIVGLRFRHISTGVELCTRPLIGTLIKVGGQECRWNGICIEDGCYDQDPPPLGRIDADYEMTCGDFGHENEWRVTFGAGCLQFASFRVNYRVVAKDDDCTPGRQIIAEFSDSSGSGFEIITPGVAVVTMG